MSHAAVQLLPSSPPIGSGRNRKLKTFFTFCSNDINFIRQTHLSHRRTHSSCLEKLSRYTHKADVAREKEKEKIKSIPRVQRVRQRTHQCHNIIFSVLFFFFFWFAGMAAFSAIARFVFIFFFFSFHEQFLPFILRTLLKMSFS